MLVSDVDYPYYVRAKAGSADVLLDDGDAFLICGGRLVGPKTTHFVEAGGRGTIFQRLDAGPVRQCTAGGVAWTSAGCASGQRKRTCDAEGFWGSYSATCS
jgi:hypothetical protein